MKVRVSQVLIGIPVLLLAISYCLVVYIFVTKAGLLENQIGRITAVIDLGGLFSIPLIKRLLKRYLTASLWVLASAILIATVVQVLAVSKLHGVKARVAVKGEPAAVANCELDVYFLDGGPEFYFDTTGEENLFLYRTRDRVLIWEQQMTVVAIDGHTGAEDRKTLDWPFESLWDISGDQVVDLELQLLKAEVKVVVDPPDASVHLTTCIGEDTTGDFEIFSGQSQFVDFGDKISISASRRGYITGFDDLGLEPIRNDTTIHLSLNRKPSTILVNAYNIGGYSVSNAVVFVGGARTEYRAGENFNLPWGKAYDIAVEFVNESNDTLRSRTHRVTLLPDIPSLVSCTLRFIN